MKRPTRLLLLVTGPAVAAVVAAGARAAYVAALAPKTLSDDEISFWTIAGNVAKGHGFSYQGIATAWRPPLYTFAVALARWSHATPRAVEYGQAVLGAATPVLIYCLARRLGVSAGGARLAAWAAAVYPPFIYFAGRVLSENFAIPLYVLALWATVEWLARRDTTSTVWCGVAWGVAVLGRPTSAVAVVVAASAGVMVIASQAPITKALSQGALVAIISFAFVVPWMLRNNAAVGGLEPVTSNEGVTLWAPNRLDTTQLKNVFNDPKYPGLQDYVVYGRAFPGIETLARAKGFDFDHASEAAQDKWFRNLALDAIKADPGRFAARTIERAGLAMLPAPDNASQTSKTGTLDRVGLVVTSGPVIVLGVIGLVLWVRRRPAVWFLAVAGLVSLLFTAFHLPYVRYRVDGVDPVLIAAAAWLVADVLWPKVVAPAR